MYLGDRSDHLDTPSALRACSTISSVKLLARLAINAIALLAAATLVGGIEIDSGFWTVVSIAAVFGIVNAILKPVAILLSLPVLILTLGLFTLVINAAMLGITAWFMDGFDVDGFGSAVFGAVVVSVVSWALSMFMTDDDDRARARA